MQPPHVSQHPGGFFPKRVWSVGTLALPRCRWSGASPLENTEAARIGGCFQAAAHIAALAQNLSMKRPFHLFSPPPSQHPRGGWKVRRRPLENPRHHMARHRHVWYPPRPKQLLARHWRRPHLPHDRRIQRNHSRLCLFPAQMVDSPPLQLPIGSLKHSPRPCTATHTAAHAHARLRPRTSPGSWSYVLRRRTGGEWPPWLSFSCRAPVVVRHKRNPRHLQNAAWALPCVIPSPPCCPPKVTSSHTAQVSSPCTICSLQRRGRAAPLSFFRSAQHTGWTWSFPVSLGREGRKSRRGVLPCAGVGDFRWNLRHGRHPAPLHCTACFRGAKQLQRAPSFCDFQGSGGMFGGIVTQDKTGLWLSFGSALRSARNCKGLRCILRDGTWAFPDIVGICFRTDTHKEAHNCSHNYCLLHIAKRVIWGVVFTHPVGHSRPPSAVNDPSVTK